MTYTDNLNLLTRFQKTCLKCSLFLLLGILAGCDPGKSENKPFVLSKDGGWCWFEDPRVIINNGKMIAGTVATGYLDSTRSGDIEALVYDLNAEETTKVELYDQLNADDHNSPVFLRRPDGRYLTLFARHGPENHFYYRISEKNDPTRWNEIKQYVPSESTRLTYSNLYMLSAEDNRVYDFFRGLDDSYKPSYVYSDTHGDSWETGNVYIDVPTERRHRPYVRYASNDKDEIHMLYTEGHPRVYANSIYHIFYKDGNLHRSDGTVIRKLSEGLNKPEEGTLIYEGDPDHVAWSIDVELDNQNHPYAVYSVRRGEANIPYGEAGKDIRYRYARWDGNQWQEYSLAYAGTRLYAGEDDYSGLVALDPNDPNVVYISADVDPETGEDLISESDGKRHYEIFKGVTQDGGENWSWTAITQNSEEDNIRPIVPEWNDEETMLLWLKGEYRTYTDYDLKVMALRMQAGS